MILSKKFKLKTYFILDHWISDPIKLFGLKNNLFFPDVIFCVDENLSKELIKQGADSKNLYNVGHLGINHKLNILKKINSSDIERIKQKVNVKTKKVLLICFDWFGLKSDLTFAQYKILNEVLDCIEKNNIKDISITIKLHPSDTDINLEKYILYLKPKIPVIIHNYLKDYEAISICDFVLGFNTMIVPLAIEAGKPIKCVVYLENYKPKIKYTFPFYKKYKLNSKDELSGFLQLKEKNLNPGLFIDTDYEFIWNIIKRN